MAAAKLWSSSSTASFLRSTPHLTPSIDNHIPFSLTTSKSPLLRTLASLRREHGQSDQQIRKNSRSRPPRQLISISTSDGRWHGEWTEEYVLTLRELQISDLAQNGQKDTQVFITLTIQKHTGFGLSVHGRIRTSFNRKCWNCFTSYRREIDTNFKVWVLPSSRTNHELELPEIGGDDPSVIYVKPGAEADFDTLIRDTIRLASSIKVTCSESCEKAPPKLFHIGDIGGKRPASMDKRWSRLIELKKALI